MLERMSPRRVVVALAVSALIAACGARTPVDELVEEVDAATSREPQADSGTRDVTLDVSRDVTIPDVVVDIVEEPVPGVCEGGCDDGVACTRDRCEATPFPDGAPPRGCVHEPDDSLCPPGLTCGAQGCSTLAYVCDSDRIFEATLPSGALRYIGTANDAFFSDIGLHPNGTLYGLEGSYPSQLVTVDRATAATAVAGAVNLDNANGLVVSSDGTVYVSAWDQVYTLDTTSFTTKSVATFPSGYYSGGDLAFVGGRLLIDARLGTHPPTDTLVEANLQDGSMRVIGDFGFACVWGLASSGPLLFGFTCEGNILSIDPNSGASTKLARAAYSFTGAASR
jgi:hypothetical protein